MHFFQLSQTAASAAWKFFLTNRFLKELCREKERGGAGCAVAARLYIYDESVGEILRLIVRTAASL